jgi:hypothetical protein
MQDSRGISAVARRTQSIRADCLAVGKAAPPKGEF